MADDFVLREEFLVRVGRRFISEKDGGKDRLLTGALKDAKRFTYDDAAAMVDYACSAFPEENVFVAQQRFPDREYNASNPPEFVVSVGRLYLKTFKNGRAEMTCQLEDARHYSRMPGSEVASLLQRLWPERSIFLAHRDTPFIPQPSREENGSSETSDFECDE